MDTNAKLLERVFTPRSTALTNGEPEDEEYLCYGYVRGNRRSFNIEFRRLQGSWPSLEYTWFQGSHWCPVESQFGPGLVAPAGSFVLRYSSGELIIVAGRNLRTVYQKVLEHQVKYLAEADRPSETLSDADTPIVTRLQVIEPGTVQRGGQT